MLYIRIELWPHGDSERRRVLGEAVIANVPGPDGTRSKNVGYYDVALLKGKAYSSKPGVWKKGHVKDFPRLKLGPWDLLIRALQATIGYRNEVTPEEIESKES